MGFLGDVADWAQDKASDAAGWVGDRASDAADWAQDNVTLPSVGPFGLPSVGVDLLGDTLGAVADQVGEEGGVLDTIANSPWLDPNSDSVIVNLTRMGSGQLPSSAFVDRVIEEGPGEAAALANSIDEIHQFVNPVYGIGRSAAEVVTADDPMAELRNQANEFVDDRIAFGEGLLDWGRGAGELAVGVTALSNPALAMALEQTTGVNVYEEAGNAVTGLVSGVVSDPDAVANAVVGYDKLKEEPIRWLGEQAPDIALEIATAGAGALGKIDDIAEAGMDINRAIPDVPTGQLDELDELADPADWRRAFQHAEDDPARAVMGAARDSHPEEIAAMRQALEDAGIEIIERPDSMAYGPGLRPGDPGQFIIDPDASFSAWSHEYQHFLDDQAAGYPGLRASLEDSDLRWQREQDAYQVEIDLMEELGYPEVADQLRDLMELERQRIFGELDG